jgi:ankyrin repeat protein
MSQAFLKLIQSGATAEVAAAVETDPSLAQARDPQGVSPLLWSVYTGQELIRDYLITKLASQGVDLDVFEAAAVGDDLRLRTILDGEPESANSISGHGWTPLHLAAAFATPNAVELLLRHGARVDAVSDNPQHNQPLHAATALSRNPEIVRLLLNNGAEVNARQVGGFTPIFSAAAANQKDLVELLLAHGADAHLKSDQGKTPAAFARDRGHADLAAWLEALPLSLR